MTSLSDHDVALCPSCGARIRWTVTDRGKRLPVDADPDTTGTGNRAVHRTTAGGLRSRAITADRPSLEGSEWLAMPHFATCKAPPPRTPRRGPAAPRQRRGVRPAPWQRP
ncbi:hypothetical protein [Streptomyces sp. WMMC897]|uniref:hypothetical protein n=1 Tax=Streptomyces sp. WMMC897 TaxID=3014782 RepID=UPI0022B66C72|nr:hypothetical protein [Streptomyces sp. WMMC897]MCZ7414289.1 hypothetical protein [Streptomyces sp. WMMC897]